MLDALRASSAAARVTAPQPHVVLSHIVWYTDLQLRFRQGIDLPHVVGLSEEVQQSFNLCSTALVCRGPRCSAWLRGEGASKYFSRWLKGTEAAPLLTLLQNGQIVYWYRVSCPPNPVLVRTALSVANDLRGGACNTVRKRCEGPGDRAGGRRQEAREGKIRTEHLCGNGRGAVPVQRCRGYGHLFTGNLAAEPFVAGAAFDC